MDVKERVRKGLCAWFASQKSPQRAQAAGQQQAAPSPQQQQPDQAPLSQQQQQQQASQEQEPPWPAPGQGRRSVLLVGNPALPLKGFDVAIAVLAAVNRVLPLAVTWVCQTAPTPAMLPGLPGCGLRIALHVSPPQARMLLLTLHALLHAFGISQARSFHARTCMAGQAPCRCAWAHARMCGSNAA